MLGAGETCLALPKLNLQFLTITDYLLRNFHLFRLEATYEIREDIADILPRFQVTLYASPVLSWLVTALYRCHASISVLPGRDTVASRSLCRFLLRQCTD